MLIFRQELFWLNSAASVLRTRAPALPSPDARSPDALDQVVATLTPLRDSTPPRDLEDAVSLSTLYLYDTFTSGYICLHLHTFAHIQSGQHSGTFKHF